VEKTKNDVTKVVLPPTSRCIDVNNSIVLLQDIWDKFPLLLKEGWPQHNYNQYIEISACGRGG
jgi:hypothetical protein